MCKPLIKATSCFVLNFNIVIDIDPPIISVLKSVLKFDNHLILQFYLTFSFLNCRILNLFDYDQNLTPRISAFTLRISAFTLIIVTEILPEEFLYLPSLRWPIFSPQDFYFYPHYPKPSFTQPFLN